MVSALSRVAVDPDDAQRALTVALRLSGRANNLVGRTV
jgi:hypothetical protein